MLILPAYNLYFKAKRLSHPYACTQIACGRKLWKLDDANFLFYSSYRYVLMFATFSVLDRQSRLRFKLASTWSNDLLISMISPKIWPSGKWLIFGRRWEFCSVKLIENSRFPRNIDIPRNIRAKLGGSPEYYGESRNISGISEEVGCLKIHKLYGKSRTEHPRNISPDIPRNLTKNTLIAPNRPLMPDENCFHLS